MKNLFVSLAVLMAVMSLLVFNAFNFESSKSHAESAITNGKIAYTKGIDSNKNGIFDGGSAEENTTDVFIQEPTLGAVPTMVNAPNNKADISPSFSPDGNKIVWASNVAGTFDIWVKDLTTGETTNLTDALDNGGNERWPVFSPDGTKIVYNQRKGSNNLDIWVMNSDGSSPQYVAGKKGSGKYYEDCCASFTPDGQYVVFASNRNGNFDIFRYKIDYSQQNEKASNLKQLTNLSKYQGTPSVEVSGKVLYREGSNQKMYRLDPDGAVNNGVQVPTTGHIRTPSGSPDGMKVIFGWRANSTAQLDIAIADANGQNMQFLTNDPNYSETDPAWQPVIQLPF
ncbi:hypothetical protein DYH10_00785 [Candidatus Saccharibacteria bacterium CPR2]|nr:hypothetical protein [Candidatus Saccharibacteria bacterium CPR2]